MGGYDNTRVFEKGLKLYIQKVVEREIDMIFNIVIDRVYNWIDGQGFWENQTYNMYDSIGFGKYKNGVLWNFYQDKNRIAQADRIIVYKESVMTIDGFQLLQEAINAGQESRWAEYMMVVYAAVPYAAWVDLSLGNGGDNKRGTGWWREGLVPYVKQVFNEVVSQYQG